jgi:hypothetical protein
MPVPDCGGRPIDVTIDGARRPGVPRPVLHKNSPDNMYSREEPKNDDIAQATGILMRQPDVLLPRPDGRGDRQELLQDVDPYTRFVA